MLEIQFKLVSKRGPRMKYGIDRYICLNIGIIDLLLYVYIGQLHGKIPNIEHDYFE